MCHLRLAAVCVHAISIYSGFVLSISVISAHFRKQQHKLLQQPVRSLLCARETLFNLPVCSEWNGMKLDGVVGVGGFK
jgi:hypothetical protein